MSLIYSYFSVSAIITAIISLLFGIIIFFRNSRTNANKIFVLFCFTVACWSIPYIFWPFAKTQENTLLFFQLLHIAACYVSVIYFHFVVVWLDIKNKKKYIVYLGYLLATFFVITIPTKLFISDMVPKFSMRYWAEPGILYHFYLLMFFGYFLYSSYILYKHYKVSVGVIRYQIKFVLIGMIIGFLGGSSNYFLWYDINIPPYGNILASSFVIFTGYAIIKYRFMDLRIVARSILIYLFDSFYAYIIFSILIVGYRLLWGSVYSNYSLIAGIFITPLFILSLFWLHNAVTKLLNKYVFHSLYDFQTAISKLTHELNRYTDLKSITDLIVDTVQNTMNLERAGVLLIDDLSSKKYQIAKVIGFNESNGISLVSDNLFTKYLEKSKKPLVRDEITLIARDARTQKESQRFLELRDYMEHIEASLCIPLLSNNKLIGIIVLGGKISNEAYTQQDLDLLSALSFQAAIAIDNAKLYKKVNEFNRTLQKKVDEQTQELSKKAEHLEKLLQMRTEFLDIASHQLKTPISVIRGTVSMFEEGSMDKLPEAEKKRFFHNIAVKAEKLNMIISDILRASEMDTDDFVIENDTAKPVIVEKLIKSAIDQLQYEADTRKIQLKFEIKAGKNTAVLTSGEFLEQAIYNLIDNAIKYTSKGYVKVSLDTEESDLIIKVEDTGIGIPEKDQKKLFEKFARAKNAVNMYADGSGLGLFIVKRIVEAHKGGSISMESVEGKGTTFTIKLPAANENAKDAVGKVNKNGIKKKVPVGVQS